MPDFDGQLLRGVGSDVIEQLAKTTQLVGDGLCLVAPGHRLSLRKQKHCDEQKTDDHQTTNHTRQLTPCGYNDDEDRGTPVHCYEIIEHTADIGFRAWGADPADAFANSARALMAIAAGAIVCEATCERPVQVVGHDYESLMVNWLEEILYLFDTGQFAARDFVIDGIGPTSVSARLIGEPREPVRHPWKLIVKAITYHQIDVAEHNGRWESTVFVDV